jgi:hypothetical protein
MFFNRIVVELKRALEHRTSSSASRSVLLRSLAICLGWSDLVRSRKVQFLIKEVGGGKQMAKEIKCPPCGEMIRGNNDDELVANVVSHAKDHGHELGEADRREILSTAQEI